MSHRHDMLAVIKSEPAGSIPWVPRLDLWYKANHQAGTLPAKYTSASLEEIVDDLGWGYHAVIPDLKDLRSSNDEIDRGLGIYNLHMISCRAVLNNIRREVSIEGDGKSHSLLQEAPLPSVEDCRNLARGFSCICPADFAQAKRTRTSASPFQLAF